MSLRPSFARTLCWILAACLAAWAAVGEAGTVRHVPRTHEAARTFSGGSSVSGTCRRENLLGWLSADVAADRFHPEAATSVSVERSAVPRRVLALVLHVTSPDRATIRCRST